MNIAQDTGGLILNARERIKTTLSHKETDILPVDFGSTPVTGLSASLIYQLRSSLGLKQKPIKIIDPFQMIGEIDEDLRKYLPTDIVSIMPQKCCFGVENANWREWQMFDGTPVLLPGALYLEADDEGNILVYPQGDSSVAPSAKMPVGGYYFDALIRQKPINNDKLLKVENNLEEFTLFQEEELTYHEQETSKIYKETDYAIIGIPGGTALGDVALLPALGLKDPGGIRDIEEWYLSMVMRKPYLKELFDRQTDIALENLKLYRQAVGDKIEVIYLCGTDFGTQNAPFCSVDTYRELYMPYYKKMTTWIHTHTKWKIFKHSCGAVEPLMKSFIETGFDIINPVQC